jgi:hypothetical protein
MSMDSARLRQLSSDRLGGCCEADVRALVDVLRALAGAGRENVDPDLADPGLVTRRKEGQWRYYDATDRAERLFGALDGTEGER